MRIRNGLAILCILALVAMPAWGQSDSKSEESASEAKESGEATEIYAGGTPDAEALGWRVGSQAYSFNKFSFFEAVDKVAQMGLKYIEAYPGQKLSPEQPDVVFSHDMSPDLYPVVQAKLKEKGVKLVNYGVVGLSRDEAQCREVFDFAKAMGIETLCSEPPQSAFDLLDKLVEEYGINVALHNHPKKSRYWDYKSVLKAVEGHSKRIGACADTGHWMRSDINPLEAIKALEGRIISFHFKDLNKYGKEGAHDVIWGTGEADVKALLAEVKRQGFQGVFSVEWEINWLNSVPDISQSVKYFNEVAAALAGK